MQYQHQYHKITLLFQICSLISAIGSNIQPIQICTNSSLPTPPFPSKSNSSIIATSSSSSSPSPNSRATLLKSSKLIIPLSSVSNNANALNISSLGSRCPIKVAATTWKAGRVRRRRPAGTWGCWFWIWREDWDCWASAEEGGMPCVVRRFRISDLGRSKPRALRATLNSW